MKHLSLARLVKEAALGIFALVLGFGGMVFMWPVSVFGFPALARMLDIGNADIYRLTGGFLYPDDVLVLGLILPFCAVAIFLGHRAMRHLREFGWRLAVVPVVICLASVAFSLWESSKPAFLEYDWSVEDNSPFACIGFSGCRDFTSYGWPLPVYSILERPRDLYGTEYVEVLGLACNLVLLALFLWFVVWIWNASLMVVGALIAQVGRAR